MYNWKPIPESNVIWRKLNDVIEFSDPDHRGLGAIYYHHGIVNSGNNADEIFNKKPEIREFLIGLLRMLK